MAKREKILTHIEELVVTALDAMCAATVREITDALNEKVGIIVEAAAVRYELRRLERIGAVVKHVPLTTISVSGGTQMFGWQNAPRVYEITREGCRMRERMRDLRARASALPVSNKWKESIGVGNPEVPA